MIETKFKDTELGPIPKDWEVGHFEDFLINFSAGATPYRGLPSNFIGSIPWISSGELDYNEITDTKEYISLEAQKKTHLTLHKPGTFLMAITGLEAEGTRGRCAFVKTPATTNQSCLAINSSDLMTVKYLYWFYRLWSDYLAFNFSQGSKQQSFTAEIVKKLPIYAPTKKEQEIIAEVLMDTDALIKELDVLIEKKRALLQGTMQELLTARRRLPGFSGPWFAKSLNDILSYEQPTSYLVSNTEYVENGIPVLTAGKTFILGYTSERQNVYDDIPVIIFDDFTTDSKWVDFPFKAKSSAMKMLKLKSSEHDFKFIFYLMQIIPFEAAEHKRHWITEYSKIELYVPPKKEQEAIASILFDMDSEISELEAKRDKYISIRQGMMQQLLTGKIRLI